jgi:hypothetical protein
LLCVTQGVCSGGGFQQGLLICWLMAWVRAAAATKVQLANSGQSAGHAPGCVAPGATWVGR